MGRGATSVANVTSGRGQGAAKVAAVVSIAGNSDVDPTTALLHQVVPYDDEDVVLGIPKAPILSGHEPQTTYKVTLKIPSYDPETDLWQRYTQQVEFYMEAIFPGTTFDLTSTTLVYTPQQDKTLYKVLCLGICKQHWETLEEQFKGRGAEGFRHLDQQERGDIHRRKADAHYNKENLRFTEEMDVNTYSNKLHKLHKDLIKLGIESRETCAMNLILSQVTRLPARFTAFAHEQQRTYL